MPTSGEGPYVFSATFEEKSLINNGTYVFELRAFANVGSCPVDGVLGNNLASQATSLLNTGSVSISGDVPAGSCRAYTALVRNIITDTIISQKDVFVDNV